jgi:ribose 1,5-bisphosphokinase
MSGRFIAVVGPSGVGKDTVMEALAARESRLVLARRVITRPADAGGEQFEGVDEATFKRRKCEGAFALSWRAHDLCYGIPASVDADLAAGRDVLANLSRAVLPEARLRFPDLIVLSLTAQPEVLRARLLQRGRETRKDIEARLARPANPLPRGLDVIEIDNSGPIEHTLAAAHNALYPGGAGARKDTP